MTGFFFIAGTFLLFVVAVGLVRILRGPEAEDRMMAAQLLGSGGIAVLLLGAGGGVSAALDVALVFALLAAFVPVVFSNNKKVSEESESDSLRSENHE